MTLPIKKTPNTNLLYINSTIPNIRKLRKVKTTPSIWLVRNDCTLEWSFILCSKSPINFVSKKYIGNFSNFIKKSLTRDMLMRIEMWSNSHLRIKSVAVRPMTIISSPRRTSQIKLMSSCFIPTSTIDWVRNGNISCKIQLIKSPIAIWIKYFL